jgi:hypothetical protein
MALKKRNREKPSAPQIHFCRETEIPQIFHAEKAEGFSLKGYVIFTRTNENSIELKSVEDIAEGNLCVRGYLEPPNSEIKKSYPGCNIHGQLF